jgi:hypothetical protein
MKDVAALISCWGEHHYGTAHVLFGLPVLRTAKKHLEKFAEHMHLNGFVFDGRLENVTHITDALWHTRDPRVTLLSDGTFVHTRISVKRDGRVEGVRDALQLSPERTAEIFDDPRELVPLKQEILPVVGRCLNIGMLHSADPLQAPLPIFAFLESTTSVTSALQQKLGELEQVVRSLPGAEYWGQCVDGEPHNIGRPRLFAELMLALVSERGPKWGGDHIYDLEYIADSLLHCDGPHIVKLIRNRVARKKCEMALLPHVESKFNFREMGLRVGIPEAILDESNKMDDHLPVHIARRVYLREAINAGAPGLIGILALLAGDIRSRLDDGLTRVDRLNLKSIGFGMVLMQSYGESMLMLWR